MDATPTPPTGPDPYDPPQAPVTSPGRSPALSALGGAVGDFLVILSALVGFVATCFPAGLVMEGGFLVSVKGTVPWLIGLVGGGLAGFVTARLFFRRR